MIKSRALLIGLNYTHVNKETVLTGCINDVKNMNDFILDVMGSECNITLITDEDSKTLDNVSSNGIQVALLDLCIKSWSENLDTVIFHYSGHGRQTTSLSTWGYINSHSISETDGLDEGIVPIDYIKYGIIRDDILNAIFTRFNPKTRILCIFDCCHSGSILDLSYQWGLNGLQNGNEITEPNIGFPHIICLSAGRDVDIAGEVHKKQDTGAFTTYLLEYMNKNGYYVNILTMQEKINNILDENGYDQIHTISSTNKISHESLGSFLLHK